MKYGNVDTPAGIDFTLPEITDFTKETLSGFKRTNKPAVFIGGSVWSDPVYKGTIYPPKTPIKQFLSAYSKQFNTVEVNATRYGVPKLTTIEKWRDSVGEDFKFSFKVPQVISHRKDINDEKAFDKMNDFIEGLMLMGDKAGTSFYLSANYHDENYKDNFKQFIGQIPEDLPVAFEFRNQRLQEDGEFADFLRKYNKAMCITDTPGRRDVVHMNLPTPTLYVRFLGCRGDETDELRLTNWINRIEELVDLGLQEVYFMIHQPAPEKYLLGDSTRLLVEEFNKRLPEVALKAPIDYTTGNNLTLGL